MAHSEAMIFAAIFHRTIDPANEDLHLAEAYERQEINAVEAIGRISGGAFRESMRRDD